MTMGQQDRRNAAAAKPWRSRFGLQVTAGRCKAVLKAFTRIEEDQAF
jgi:hypothetical protein